MNAKLISMERKFEHLVWRLPGRIYTWDSRQRLQRIICREPFMPIWMMMMMKAVSICFSEVAHCNTRDSYCLNWYVCWYVLHWCLFCLLLSGSSNNGPWESCQQLTQSPCRPAHQAKAARCARPMSRLYDKSVLMLFPFGLFECVDEDSLWKLHTHIAHLNLKGKTI